MTGLSNSLSDLAERVREATEISAAASRTSIEKALEAGHILCEAKEQCRHGEWLPFLARANVHERQARRLMQLSRSGLEIGLVSDLGGVGAALQWLAEFTMPGPGETLLVSLDNFEHRMDQPLAFIWREEAGFHVALIDLNEASPEAIITRRAVQDERAARITLYRMIDCRLSDATFSLVNDSHFDRSFVEELRKDIARSKVAIGDVLS